MNGGWPVVHHISSDDKLNGRQSTDAQLRNITRRNTQTITPQGIHKYPGHESHVTHTTPTTEQCTPHGRTLAQIPGRIIRSFIPSSIHSLVHSFMQRRRVRHERQDSPPDKYRGPTTPHGTHRAAHQLEHSPPIRSFVHSFIHSFIHVRRHSSHAAAQDGGVSCSQSDSQEPACPKCTRILVHSMSRHHLPKSSPFLHSDRIFPRKQGL